MRIAHISPGAGGMLCGACLHDNTLAGALMRQGHDVALIPIYTPMRTDEEDVSGPRVFFGALNVFLRQRSRLYRHLPAALTGFLNRPGVIKLLARGDANIDASFLGDLTVSMLRGEDGNQARELDELVRWLRDDYRPDVVHLSNSLLLGFARRLRQELKVPLVCSLQGEEIFLQGLVEPYQEQVHDLLRRRAMDVDAFIAPSSVYAGVMADMLGVDRDRVHHVPLGLHMEGHGGPRPVPRDRPFTIGYLARICPEKGLHLLVEAFVELARSRGSEAVRLRVAGYLGGRDRAYLEKIKARVRNSGLEEEVEFLGEIDRPTKIEFLCNLDVLSVPTPYHEPKGLFVLEALANGTPVVQPDHGAFPELLAATGGGLLYAPDQPGDLVRALMELQDDRRLRQEMGRKGRESVRELFDDRLMAQRTVKIYHGLVNAMTPGTGM